MSKQISMQRLLEGLGDTELAACRWVKLYEQSNLRLPKRLDHEGLAVTLGAVIEAFVQVLEMATFDENLEFRAGSLHLREVEKEVCFVASRLGADDFGGFDIGALIYSLRDFFNLYLEGQEQFHMQSYMEWLVLLAEDSFATGRICAAKEQWSNELDKGMPLLMVTAELPAAIFICKPNFQVCSGVFGRLLLCVVRVGAKAVIIDVSGMSCGFSTEFASALTAFLMHERVSQKISVFVRGARGDERTAWQSIGNESGTQLIFEDYFDLCVSRALGLGGWRLLSPA